MTEPIPQTGTMDVQSSISECSNAFIAFEAMQPKLPGKDVGGVGLAAAEVSLLRLGTNSFVGNLCDGIFQLGFGE